jgi:phosphoribosylformylglycinamidine (FGAM) synthase-like amidotransferase family enzyme
VYFLPSYVSPHDVSERLDDKKMKATAKKSKNKNGSSNTIVGIRRKNQLTRQ